MTENFSADLVGVGSIERGDRVETVAGEGRPRVVHDWQQIVTGSEVIKPARVHRLESKRVAGNNVLPEDLHEAVAINVVVHVIVAERVDDFVSWKAAEHAAGSG